MARASKRVYEALRHLCDGRVFVAPRRESDDQALPYITHQMISDVPVNSLDGYTGHSRCRVQIDCYAATYGAAEELCQRVKMSVNNASGAPLMVFAMLAAYLAGRIITFAAGTIARTI